MDQRKSSLHERMSELLAKYPSSGQSVAEFCATHNLSTYKYHYWQRKLEGESSQPESTSSNGFVKVAVAEEQINRRFTVSTSSYFCHFPNGRKLEIPQNFNPVSLRTLVSLLSQ